MKSIRRKKINRENPIIEAFYLLSGLEQRLLLVAMSSVVNLKVISERKYLYVKISDFNASNNLETIDFNSVKKVLNRFYERSIHIVIKGVSIKTRWVQDVCFIDEEEVVGIRISQTLIPFIDSLYMDVQKYLSTDILRVNNFYSVKIYNLLIFENTEPTFSIEVDKLRELLGVGERYQLYADLKRWVIDVALNQIRQHTVNNITYTEHKIGRKVNKLIFAIKPDQGQSNEIIKLSQPHDMMLEPNNFSDILKIVEDLYELPKLIESIFKSHK